MSTAKRMPKRLNHTSEDVRILVTDNIGKMSSIISIWALIEFTHFLYNRTFFGGDLLWYGTTVANTRDGGVLGLLLFAFSQLASVTYMLTFPLFGLGAIIVSSTWLIQKFAVKYHISIENKQYKFLLYVLAMIILGVVVVTGLWMFLVTLIFVFLAGYGAVKSN